MAITRCPYCHAIIDEVDKYCNNCGTQLLFAEDDEVEEEIPGEKIVDAEVEEKDYTVDEPEEEKRRKPVKDLESEIVEELGDKDDEDVTKAPALEELVDEEGAEEDVTEEVILVDEIEASEKKAAAPGAGDAEEDEDEPEDEDEDVEVIEDEDLEDEEDEDDEKDKKDVPREEETREYAAGQLKKTAPAPEPAPPAPAESEPEVEYVVEPAPPDEASTAGEAAFRPATFDTKELENLGRTVDLSKAKVDEFLEVIEGQHRPVTPPAPTPEPSRAPVTTPAEPLPAAAPTPVDQPVETASDEAVPTETPAPSTGSLPPWASTMKGAPVFSEDSGPVETRKFRGGEPAGETEEEVEIFPRRRPADSTIGLPEKISQSPLPFEEPEPKAEDFEELAEEAEEAEAEEGGETRGAGARDLTPEQEVLSAGEVRAARESVLPGREPAAGGDTEGAAAEEYEEPGPRPPFSFSVFFKSKAFDALFVGLFWLVALWLAAASLGVTLFAILASMSGSMLLLYVVFLAIYIFLFKFFLGETLGDRLFRPRE
jgi:hypothetical protein